MQSQRGREAERKLAEPTYEPATNTTRQLGGAVSALTPQR